MGFLLFRRNNRLPCGEPVVNAGLSHRGDFASKCYPATPFNLNLPYKRPFNQ